MKRNGEAGSRNAEWMTVRLCDVVEIDRTGVDPAKLESQVSYVGLEHLDASGGINWSETIGSAGIKSTKFRFGPDHILFGKLRPYLRKVVRPDREGVCSTDILPLLPKSGFDKGFLFHLLRTDDVIQRATQACAGANLPRLSPEKFRVFEFRVPRSLPEQKRIASILDKADAIRRKLQQSLRLSDDLLRSVFLDMFGDPVTNPKGWPRHNLTSVIGDSFRNGLSPSTSGTVAGKVLTLSAVTSGTFAPQFLRDAIFDRTPSDNQQVTRNTFLICRGNGNKSMVGIGVFPEADMPSVSFPDTMIACTIDRTQIEPEYLQAVWSTAKVRKQIDAGARTTNGTYKVNQTLLGSIEFPLPTLEIQKKFSDITQATRTQSAKTAELTAESEALFSSLQQRAFRGEL